MDKKTIENDKKDTIVDDKAKKDKTKQNEMVNSH
jgi:hypothetical protein